MSALSPLQFATEHSDVASQAPRPVVPSFGGDKGGGGGMKTPGAGLLKGGGAAGEAEGAAAGAGELGAVARLAPLLLV